MKKTILTIILCGVIALVFTVCGKSENKLGGDKPLEKNFSEVVFTISKKNNSCIPVDLVLYKDGTYELFTAYESCRPSEVCYSMLKYTKSIKGKYDYDVIKIVENSVDADNKGYAIDNLPEYEIYMGSSYVENGYSYLYTVEKGQINQYLDELLEKINVDLKLCAEPEYID